MKRLLALLILIGCVSVSRAMDDPFTVPPSTSGAGVTDPLVIGTINATELVSAPSLIATGNGEDYGIVQTTQSALNFVVGNSTPVVMNQSSMMVTGSARVTEFSTTRQPCGIIATVLASSATSAAASEQTLYSYTLPANILTSAGSSIRASFWGSTAANTNLKNHRIKFGATEVITSGNVAANAVEWRINATITKVTAANTQSALGEWLSSASAALPPTLNASAPGETTSGTVLLLMTAQNGSASADSTLLGGYVEYCPE